MCDRKNAVRGCRSAGIPLADSSTTNPAPRRPESVAPQTMASRPRGLGTKGDALALGDGQSGYPDDRNDRAKSAQDEYGADTRTACPAR